MSERRMMQSGEDYEEYAYLLQLLNWAVNGHVLTSPSTNISAYGRERIARVLKEHMQAFHDDPDCIRDWLND